MQVKTLNGEVKGRIDVNSNLTKFYSFLGIPYAEAPIENLRFKSPVPISNWDNVFDATKDAKVCYHMDGSVDPTTEGEDCLNLNVYVPAQRDLDQSQNLPVLVYIHGGAFLNGSASFNKFGPHFLMDYNVIVVTVAYRLGIFGFLSTEDSVIPGNFGLKDQQVALKWIKNNIQCFGGDPCKITAYGQSAGASSLGYQLLNKESEGLFRGAILASGSPLCPWAFQSHAKKIAYKTLNIINPDLNEENTDSKKLLQHLTQIPAAELRDIAVKVAAIVHKESDPVFNGFCYAPVIEPDHEDAFLTGNIYGLLESGSFYKCPTLIGLTSEEFLYLVGRDYERFKEGCKLYDAYLTKVVPENLEIEDKAVKKELAKTIKKMYVSDKSFSENPASLIRMGSDNAFNRSIIKHAMLQSKYCDTYFYQFSYRGNIGSVPLNVEGAEKVGHAEENNYIWRKNLEKINNTDPSKISAEDLKAQGNLLEIWTNFCKYLNPLPKSVKEWPVLTEKNAHYLDINSDLELKKDPKAETFKKWDDIYQEFGKKPLNTF